MGELCVSSRGRIAILRGYRLRPVEAAVFRPVLKGGRVQDEALSAFSAAQIVKRYAYAWASTRSASEGTRCAQGS